MFKMDLQSYFREKPSLQDKQTCDGVLAITKGVYPRVDKSLKELVTSKAEVTKMLSILKILTWIFSASCKKVTILHCQ